MSVILYINGQKVDLDSKTVIAQTKQANDINSISTRQANYTNRFVLPKTANNVKVMQFLSVTGNKSNVPYQKNECSLYSETGECFVYKGWAVVTDGGDNYDVVVYDGIIDVYKAIENKTLNDLDLSELAHLKSVDNVKNSWINADLNYKYILADYNGNTGDTASGIINIDYLVPSVKISYLWNKMWTYLTEQIGATYSGSIFLMQNFKNLYMTYPKGITTSDSEAEIFESTDYGYKGTYTNLELAFLDQPVDNRYYARFNTATINELESSFDNIHLKVEETGTYRIEVSGSLSPVIMIYDFAGEEGNTVTVTSDFKLYIVKNAEGLNPSQGQVAETILANVGWQDEFEQSKLIQLNAHDSIALVIAQVRPYGDTTFIMVGNNNLSAKLTKINENNIDFGEALIDFSMRDFMQEIVTRFGLTMFKDRNSNNYHFLTLQELLQTSQVVDWSSKFHRKINENYIYGTYAQRNWFRYNYNDKEASHNDSYIDVNNVNLPDARDVIKSKVYSPESPANRVKYLGFENTNVYKLWDKELVENPEEGEDPYKYKSLDKRYYFLRAQPVTEAITIESKTLEQMQAYSGTVLIENYHRLPYYDIVQDYYQPIKQILNKAVLMNVELWLKETDIVKLDFKKLYYIEQLSSYFLVNKVNNYMPGKVTKVELVKVDYYSV